MANTLYWLQCGACGGDSMGLLTAEFPGITEMGNLLDIEVLWHPSLSNASPTNHTGLLEALLNGEQPLDILCVEGSIIRGPGGTGMYDALDGKPKKDIMAGLAGRAKFVIAAGTCASFGGIGADSEIEATGIQFLKRNKGGFIGEAFASAGGMPVINLPGCPCNGDVLMAVIAALCSGKPPLLTEFNSPVEWYNMLVHQGCSRNEYHEYRVEDSDFGDKGCLFFHQGCHGPLVYGPCNKILSNKHSSKTRVGVPCVGCTSPDFPQSYPFFTTRNIAGIPLELPDGMDRAHYLAYKSMAAAAAPDRLQKRLTRV